MAINKGSFYKECGNIGCKNMVFISHPCNANRKYCSQKCSQKNKVSINGIINKPEVAYKNKIDNRFLDSGNYHG